MRIGAELAAASSQRWPSAALGPTSASHEVPGASRGLPGASHEVIDR
jgi:hypothetical protein